MIQRAFAMTHQLDRASPHLVRFVVRFVGFTCLPSSSGSPSGMCEVACTGNDTGNLQCTAAIVDATLPHGFFPSSCTPSGLCGY